MKQPRSEALYLRVTPDTKQRFVEKASRYGTPSDVLRELIMAFVEGRVTLHPPTDRKESLYNEPGKQD